MTQAVIVTDYSVMVEVCSSAIRAVGYLDGTLTVVFRNGRVYDHPNVPYCVYLGLIKASSAGA